MPLSDETSRMQRALADYCRDADFRPLPGVRQERASHYRRLVFGGVKTTLRNAYPIAYQTLGREAWEQLVETFFAEYACDSPQLWKMPRGLYDYVRETGYAAKIGCPYLNDLLLFEWTEIEVFMMEDKTHPAVSPISDLLNEPLVINREHRILKLSYPVFRLKGEELLNAKGSYLLVAYRNPSTMKVWFSELTPFTAAVVELLRDEPLRGVDVLEAALAFVGADDKAAATRAIEKLLHDQIILGALCA